MNGPHRPHWLFCGNVGAQGMSDRSDTARFPLGDVSVANHVMFVYDVSWIGARFNGAAMIADPRPDALGARWHGAGTDRAVRGSI